MDRISSQLSILQRSEISNPPSFGARVMNLILNNEEMFNQWQNDVQGMSSRIVRSHLKLAWETELMGYFQIEMRNQLKDLLVNKYKTPGSWEHITSQIGM